jgi:hypothetical protein
MWFRLSDYGLSPHTARVSGIKLKEEKRVFVPKHRVMMAYRGREGKMRISTSAVDKKEFYSFCLKMNLDNSPKGKFSGRGCSVVEW